MESFGHQLQLRMTQHMNVADQQLKEYIMKTVQKKVITFLINIYRFFFLSIE